MKPYLKYISPLLFCGLIIFVFINISIEKLPLVHLHIDGNAHTPAADNIGAEGYLFYKHMFVDMLTH